MSPSRSSRATRSASNGGGSSTTVPAAAALRTSTISPPTCDSGIGTSQRSSGSEPSTAPAARTCAARLPKVSSTGRGVRVVPEVWTTSASSSSSGSAMLNGAPPSSASGWLTSTSAPRSSSRALALGQPQVDRHGGRAQQQAAVDGGHERPARAAARSRRGRRAGRRAARAGPPRGSRPAAARGRSAAPRASRARRRRDGARRRGRARDRFPRRPRLMSGRCPSNGPRPGSTQTSATRWPRGSPRSPSTAPRCATRSAPRR